MTDAKTSIEWIQKTLSRGFEALNNNQIKLAAECCRKVLDVKPDLVQAHFLVGLVALEADDRKTAFHAFSTVTKIDKNHAAAWAQLAKLFMGDGQVSRADAALQEAAGCDSDDPYVFDLLGSIYSLMGEYHLARDWFLKANTKQANDPSFMLNLANNYVYHGETTAANKLFKQIIAVQPNSPQAHWSLAGASKAKDYAHINQMHDIANQNKLHPRAIPFYCYAIGKELEDLQEWDKAFAAFAKGAAARRSFIEYDEAAEIEMFDYLDQEYTQAWFNSLAKGHSTRAPIFVLGQPRTGTTLIERIITSHSQVHSAGELQQFGLVVRRLTNHQDSKRFSTGLFAKAKQLEPAKLGEMYMQTSKRMQGETPHFVDKLPQNYLFIPLILAALPEAKVVHLNREPMDACFASFKQLFADAYLHSYEQEEMARHHVRYRRLMDIWRERFPGQFFDIDYEDTATNLEPQARMLIDYLELPWEETCLQFYEHDAAVSTASAVQVREPVHTRSIGRWKKYAKQLQPMQAILRQEGLVD